MDAIVSEVSIDCRSDVGALWDAIADTERLNRALGMSRISFRPLSDRSAARYTISTRIAGIPVEYEERPFEWVYKESFSVLRDVRSGPVSQIALSLRFSPRSAGPTTITARLAITPRIPLLGAFIRVMTRRAVKEIGEAIASVDAELSRGGTPHAPTSRGALHKDALQRAERALADLASPDLARRLARHVEEADDLDAGRIRPFALADGWRMDRLEVLGACLAGVRAGLLELKWEVACPSCRTAATVIPSLSALAAHDSCQFCEIQFAVDLDDAVEATFSPAPAVRAIDLGPYCIGGPALTPHVLTQSIIPAGGAARIKCPAEEGRYRLFLRGGAISPIEVAKDAPDRVAVDKPSVGGASPIRVAPSGTLELKNPGREESHAKIERVEWLDQAAKARAVVTMPGFRRDFSQDILRPGMALKVARVGIFFSDLTGSTQLYTDTGDAAAFKLVHDHFDVVIEIIEKNRGTLVKTIGDAVMAAFADDLDGLLASVAILHAFEDFRAAHPDRRRTHIKLGVFGGPCYAVTANNVLDYFGQTVNLAARLQGEARSGELVVTAELADRALAAKAIPPEFVAARYDAKLKGVPQLVAAARIRVTGKGPGTS